jgi:cytochrome c oxidase cbb3-type subunit 3
MLLRYLIICLFFFVLIWSSACQREKRQFQTTTPVYKSFDLTMGTLRPGTPPPPSVQNQYEENAYAVSEGKRLFTQYNCTGCHFNGGGGIGPPLMDDLWIYGSEPVNIFATIVEGRPNGMPSFKQKIPDDQVWELVSYVRSMSGQLRKDVAPGRSDDMNAHKSEQSTEKKIPKPVSVPQ